MMCNPIIRRHFARHFLVHLVTQTIRRVRGLPQSPSFDENVPFPQRQDDPDNRDFINSMVLVISWIIFVWGVTMGFGTVCCCEGIARWILSSYSAVWLLFYVVLLVVLVVVGPDLAPPVTICNGSEHLWIRLATTAFFLALEQMPLLSQRTPHAIWVFSAAWHFIGSNDQHKTILHAVMARTMYDRSSPPLLQDNELQAVKHAILLQYFRVGAALGMLCGYGWYFHDYAGLLESLVMFAEALLVSAAAL